MACAIASRLFITNGPYFARLVTAGIASPGDLNLQVTMAPDHLNSQVIALRWGDGCPESTESATTGRAGPVAQRRPGTDLAQRRERAAPTAVGARMPTPA